MCGIVAAFSSDGKVSAEALESGTRRLFHRGPDGQRCWISGDGRVGLGHARLSIIDLTTGDQPIASQDERIRIVVNGEFYGFEAIRSELQGRGHRFRTKSDSEIALHLYEDYGLQFLQHLRGEFALVLWDGRRRRLIAARDRFGIKPLFFARTGGTLLFASEAKALFAMGVPPRWDEESVFHATMMTGYQSRTLYEGISQIPPGNFAIATDRHFQMNRYWDFDYPEIGGGDGKKTDADHVAEFRTAFEEAVRIRLRADVPVGVYLSGGLDSCSVLGMAARHHPEPLKAFTLTFEDVAYDEGAIAKEMAALTGAEYYPIPIGQRDLADNFADAIAQSETFCVNAHGVAKYLLSRAVRDAGYKVVLTGEGSDEILGGYAHFRRDMLLYNREGQDEAEIEKLLAWLEEHNTVSRGLLLPDGAIGPVEPVRRVLGFVPSWIETFSSRAMKLRPLLSEDFRTRFADHEDAYPILDEVDVRRQLSGRAPLSQSLYLWAKTALCTYILTMLGDRMEMGHSIEGRVPFLDHKVVETLVSQPVHMKIRGMTEKYVLREAVKDAITDTVYQRQKHPFLSPPATLNPDDTFHAFVEDTLRGRVFGSIPFFDQKRVVELLDRLPGMDEGARTANDQILMQLMSMSVLHERFGMA
ncbi:MAG TPA: asparagine synthase (glutamine-hydrolyzing) [Candidatus Saccharimonadales bacterium]|nr:asparagine synthase (glutamine-hydrolyzing) [Candidatus Saccharimonadales bacterium]